MTHSTIIRLPQVQSETGLSKSTLYLRIKQGLFPPGVRLGKRATGWPAFEIEALNRAQISGATEDQIKALVSAMAAERINNAPGAM